VAVFSEDLGVGKPDQSIFVEACRQAGQQPSKCIHIGDNLVADVQASHQSGLRSVWVDRLGKKSDFPAQRITSLAQLGRVLDGEVRCS
jgi:FMN phosphatase YigB (HAD superfamily)